MARPDLNGGRQRLGYFLAIFASALAHAGLILLFIFILPQFLSIKHVAPPSYTVQVVDSLPAGDLGTHQLPRLSRREAEKPKPEKRPKPESKIIPPKPDENAIALNEHRNPTPTPTPIVTPPPTPEPTATAKPHPHHTHTPRPTPRPTATPRPHRRPRPTPEPTPIAKRHHPAPPPRVMVAKAEPTPDLSEELEKVHEQLEKSSKKPPPARSNNEETPGPVVASKSLSGTGYGVGSGTGSNGIKQDPEFLLYYETIRKRIKDAWSFPGANNDLSTEVLFAIGPNGELKGIKILESSRDAAFDQSVVSAIRRAAPFPPPPENYRSQFEQGVEAEFKPGELQS